MGRRPRAQTQPARRWRVQIYRRAAYRGRAVRTVRLDITRPHDAGLEPEDLKKTVARALNVSPSAVQRVEVIKRTLDARQRLRTPSWRLVVDAQVQGKLPKARPQAQVREPKQPLTRLESPKAPDDAGPVVVVGAGPAGLFAAWHLAAHGARVVLIERGKPVETRARDFGQFRGRGILDPESNICFGEGGAGTYSDGKLTCRTKDPLRRVVLQRLVDNGAPETILVDSKPHIGTNRLFRVLKGMRADLLELGVDVRFQTRVEGLVVQQGRVRGVDTSVAGQLDAQAVLLATGHSARDTYESLLSQGVPMESKPFAVGVRAEHPQLLIDSAQYSLRGERPPTLPPADYRLAHTAKAQGIERGVYSFCMCPGGMVVPTATEPNMVVVNGMSSARRSGPYANSGLVAQVHLSDLEAQGFGTGPLAGIELQRSLERRAFEAGGSDYKAPAMRASDLVQGKFSGQLSANRFRPGLVAQDLRDVLPAFIIDGLQEGLQRFDRLLSGYASTEANLIAVESRTSSPVRIPRDPEDRQVLGFPGLFVAGEGPGYAGGIMSAALDGLHTAHAILVQMHQPA